MADGSTDPAANFRGTTFFVEGDNSGGSATRSVVGGAGVWHGARGSVVQHVIGANTTTGPNFRFVFTVLP